MRKVVASLVILSLLLMHGELLAQSLESPCDDPLFLQLKDKPLDRMTDREFKYFMQKDRQCAESQRPHPAMGAPWSTAPRWRDAEPRDSRSDGRRWWNSDRPSPGRDGGPYWGEDRDGARRAPKHAEDMSWRDGRHSDHAWLWGALGVVVVGAATAGILLLSNDGHHGGHFGMAGDLGGYRHP